MSVDLAGTRRENERDYWIETLQEQGGFTREQAYILSGLAGLDLHAVLELVTGHGCDADTAFDIYS